MLLRLPANQAIRLEKEQTRLGRSPANDIVIDRPAVSRTHCVIVREKGGHFLIDMGSTNGTFVNGQRIGEPHRLRENDTIGLSAGGEVFQFVPAGSPGPSGLRRLVAVSPWRFTVPAAAALALIVTVAVFVGMRRPGPAPEAPDTPDPAVDPFDRSIASLRRIYGEEDIPDDAEFEAVVKRLARQIADAPDFQEISARRLRYATMIETIFSEHRVPEDFSFAAWVESAYDPRAYNRRSGARGIWQLRAPTARQYGLRVDRAVDERLDPEAATVAVARYFNDLLAIFGTRSFSLALAAYNSGENEVLFALKSIRDPGVERTFWYLYKNELLPVETRQYVLKVIALMVLHAPPPPPAAPG